MKTILVIHFFSQSFFSSNTGAYSQQIVIKRKRSRIRTSAIERVRRYAEESFYEVSGTLFCRACGESVNHLKASVIKYHIRSQKHLANKIKMKSF